MSFPAQNARGISILLDNRLHVITILYFTFRYSKSKDTRRLRVEKTDFIENRCRSDSANNFSSYYSGMNVNVRSHNH